MNKAALNIFVQVFLLGIYTWEVEGEESKTVSPTLYVYPLLHYKVVTLHFFINPVTKITYLLSESNRFCL